MNKFDTKVQLIKYKVLREVARKYWQGNLLENLPNLPVTIIPGEEATMRCCVYKERAIINERIKLSLGGDRENRNVIEVIRIACDECPVGGYEVSTACRGCIAHRCAEVCPKKRRLTAISASAAESAPRFARSARSATKSVPVSTPAR